MLINVWTTISSERVKKRSLVQMDYIQWNVSNEKRCFLVLMLLQMKIILQFVKSRHKSKIYLTELNEMNKFSKPQRSFFLPKIFYGIWKGYRRFSVTSWTASSRPFSSRLSTRREADLWCAYIPTQALTCIAIISTKKYQGPNMTALRKRQLLFTFLTQNP